MTQAVTSLELPPAKHATGSMVLPGSKSISNRALLLAALSPGRTQLDGLLDADDIRVMLAALRQCGIVIDHTGQEQVTVQGQSPFPQPEGDLFMGNAGTAIRPLTAALALMDSNITLSGVPRMHERPIGDLVDALRSLGAQIDYLQTPGYPPLRIGSGRVNAGQPVRVRGDVSSQFLTALLMAAPLAAADGDVVIQVDGQLISRPYIDITCKLMAQFGVTPIQDQNGQQFTIPAGAQYQSPDQLTIEGDASSASYFMALGALGGGPVHIQGAGAHSIQGDMGFTKVVQAMGATVVLEDNAVTVSGPSVADGQRLQAFDLDFNLIPDAAMTAATMALFADGPCLLRNIASWRVKETDRIDAMHAELAKLGARVESGPDWLRVYPVATPDWQAASIKTYDDHRMAMCFSLAAFAPVPVTIMDPDCVSKTFPDYFSVYESLVRG